MNWVWFIRSVIGWQVLTLDPDSVGSLLDVTLSPKRERERERERERLISQGESWYLLSIRPFRVRVKVRERESDLLG